MRISCISHAYLVRISRLSRAISRSDVAAELHVLALEANYSAIDHPFETTSTTRGEYARRLAQPSSGPRGQHGQQHGHQHDEMRRRRIIIPGITVLERLAGQACTEAEEALYTDVAGRLTPDLVLRMETLL